MCVSVCVCVCVCVKIHDTIIMSILALLPVTSYQLSHDPSSPDTQQLSLVPRPCSRLLQLHGLGTNDSMYVYCYIVDG